MSDFETRLAAAVAEELRAVDVDAAYDEMLDECFSFDSVGGIFAYMMPSRVLAEMDPIAYRCGLSDWLDSESERLEEIGGDYYDRDAVVEIRERLEAEDEAAEGDDEDGDTEVPS